MCKKYKVYCSDIGFGHLVRQSAIAQQFIRIDPKINIDLQTKSHADDVSWIFNNDNTNIIKKFNNISWSRKDNGDPNIEKIKAFFLDYIDRSNAFILNENDIEKYSFIISDFVYEAFPIAIRYGIPSFGVAHFTWDWFFSKMYPYPLNAKIQERFTTYANAADLLFFPPFTPYEIIQHYKHKAYKVPFIVRDNIQPADLSSYNNKVKVLIMDSGANVLNKLLNSGLNELSKLNDFVFFTTADINIQSDNVHIISNKKDLAHYIPSVNIVISRGGFNTISECIAYRTPILVLGETANPEMDINMLTLKKLNLGSFMSTETISKGFNRFISEFIENEYQTLSANMKNHNLATNGAEVIADKILNYVG